MAAEVSSRFLPREHPYLLGAGFAGFTVVVLIVLPPALADMVAAVLLAMIAGAYFGFAANDGRHVAWHTEAMVGLAFGAIAVAGLWSGVLLALGYLAHGFWDLAHHQRADPPRLLAAIPAWYIPFCVVYDWIVGLFLLIVRWPA